VKFTLVSFYSLFIRLASIFYVLVRNTVVFDSIPINIPQVFWSNPHCIHRHYVPDIPNNDPQTDTQAGNVFVGKLQ
jgi:hypothetical protein